MGENVDKEQKKEILKNIIHHLHSGLSAAEAKDRFEKEIGSVTSVEIAEMEQGLINDGISPDEIKKFCNVHALIFSSALEKAASEETFPSHPIYLFKAENREIEKRTGILKDILQKKNESGLEGAKAQIKAVLEELSGLEIHYERKEQILFPYLEKYGFMGPSKVMWGKDNEVRDLLKKSRSGVDGIGTQVDLAAFASLLINPLVEETEGMIFKEENILFPASLEKLQPGDWVEILKQSDEIGYVYIQKPGETAALLKELQANLLEEPIFQNGVVSLPSGIVNLTELMLLLNTLPFDLTFVDKEDTVKYFSEGRDRIFHRTRAIIGRKVQNCHPPQSVEVVQKILTSFKAGEKDTVDFWLNVGGKLVYIRYLAIRDKTGDYQGTLEVTQDITGIQKLEGERRLLNERD